MMITTDSSLTTMSIPARRRSTTRVDERLRGRTLGEDYIVTPQDVFCELRGTIKMYHHPGNRRLDALVNMNLARYRKLDSNIREVNAIAQEIVDAIRTAGVRT